MQCPNCGADIGRFELDQNCKNCGINLFYSQQQKLLSEDAKKCELEFASFRILVAKLKASFIKGKLPIARLVLAVVCIGVLFIPFGTVIAEAQMFSEKFSIGAFGIYQAVSDGTLSALLSIKETGILSAQVDAVFVLLISIVLILLIVVALLGAELLSFINMKRSAKAMAVLSATGCACSVFSIVASIMLSSALSGEQLLSGSFGFGGIACFIAFGAMLITNYLIIKNKLEPDIKQVDLDRIAMRKRVKNGEISLDDLPLPVFESEEEKEKRLEALKISDELKAGTKGGEANG